MAQRRKFTPQFKTKIVLEMLSGDTSQAELSRRHNIGSDQLSKWKRQFLENMSRAFEAEDGSGGDGSEREDELLKKIGELTVERDFLSNGLDRSR